MSRIDEVAARLEPHEVQPALRFIELLVTAGHMSPHEADAWRRRIEGCAGYRAVEAETPPNA